MEWLQKLLSVDAPHDAALQSAGVSFRGLFPWWAALLIGLAAAAGVFLLYARERGRLGLPRRALMGFLRTAAIVLILLLLLRPVLVAEYQGERPRGVALLIDNSQSMTQRDRRLSDADRLRVAIAKDLVSPTTPVTDPAALAKVPPDTPADPERAELVRAVLANPRLQLVEGLKRQGPLRAYLFGQRLHRPATGPESPANEARLEDVLAAFKADESRTALGDAVNDLLQRKDGELPSAVVVMTDGRDNASKLPLDEAARECARLQVPLYVYGVGSVEGGTLQVRDVSVPDTLFYEDTVSVPVRWRASGLKGNVEITLSLGGKVVARLPSPEKPAPIPVGDGEGSRVLTFVPHKGQAAEEKLDLVASVKLAGSDAYKDDLKRPVRLIDRRVRVLYVENAPRWEYKFLQNALLRDRRVEPSFLLAEADPGVLHAGPPFLPVFPAREKLFTYDLVILGDVPAAFLGPEHLEWLRDFVNEGGGLVLIAGREHAPADYVDSPLAEVLPVEFLPARFHADATARPQAFAPVLTDTGKRSDMMALADTPEENARVWKELPGLFWHYPVTRLRPGAVALLEHPTLKAADQPMPVLASQYYGRGQALFLATPETWRWRFNAGDRYFARFWGQVVYQLGLPHLLGPARRAQLGLEHTDVLLGQPCSVYAHLLDAQYHPLKEERAVGQLEALDAAPGAERSRRIALEPVPGQPGEYRALLANDAPGRFELKLESPEAVSLDYRVNLPPRHELEKAGMAEEDLRRAAALSGGKFYREEDLQRLAGDVEPRKASFTRRQETLLWNPLAFLLFAGLVTVEWVVRKFSNLS